ncbi:hypothetical protein [Dictyobacter aurantiacus]|uniref:Uncharacterized protein n=1 Tax=Dictyobacter aurantiacus TaxID=1936993 RepID=A0A401ZKG9_9CHLR|nr:hypothetical protein [Dictyobacter aurantiacus]GCE07349.1 hypothetical protein KDAU_46780 [Dictyobacter aurantiacus]
MALFDDTLIEEITTLITQRHRTLEDALGISSRPRLGDEASPLRRDLWLLIGIANGEFRRSDEQTVQQAEQALARVQNLLLGNALHSRTLLPDHFWRSDIGVLLSRVRWWISSDELITISNAAALAFGSNTQANRMRVVRAIDNGFLESFPDPSVANPQQNKRVLRPQVERLRDQRSLPDIG